MTGLDVLFGLFAVSAAGFVYGWNEGIDMAEGGARTHREFPFYHRWGILGAALLVLVGVVAAWGLAPWWVPGLLLANRMAEVGYGVTRSGQPFPAYENFLGLGWYLTGWKLGSVRTGLWCLAFVLIPLTV